MLLLVCNVILSDFFKKSVFECFSWSAQCFERQARTFDVVKTIVFSSLNIHWCSFTANVVYCHIFHSFKAALVEVEKTMFTIGNLVPIFEIITPGPYTRSKQSRTFHAKCSVFVELKHTLKHKCATFSSSRLIHRYFNVRTDQLHTLS